MFIYSYLKQERLCRQGFHLSLKWVKKWEMRGALEGPKWEEAAKKHKEEESS